jgi:hypothetical protein
MLEKGHARRTLQLSSDCKKRRDREGAARPADRHHRHHRHRKFIAFGFISIPLRNEIVSLNNNNERPAADIKNKEMPPGLRIIKIIT